MRRVLILAVLVLLALGLHSWQERIESTIPRNVPKGELSLVVLARGALLPPVQNPLTEQFGTDDAVITGERALQIQPRKPGLRAALFDSDFSLSAYRNFDIAQSMVARTLLPGFCRKAREGSVLVLHNFGSVIPEKAMRDRDTRALGVLLRRIGAHGRPFSPPQSSWCFIAIRGAHGWVPLAESYSQTQGSTLAFTISPETDRYADYRGDWMADHSPREGLFSLRDELSTASWSSKTTWLLPGVDFHGAVFPALHAQPPTDVLGILAKENRIRWSGITLGASPAFRAHVALREDARGKSDGVVFSLAVNGKPVASRSVTTAAVWLPLDVDLSPFAGRTVDLELVVDPGGDPAHDKALWGNPKLSWRPMTR